MVIKVQAHIKRTNFEYKESLMSKDIKYFNALASLESAHTVKVITKPYIFLILLFFEFIINICSVGFLKRSRTNNSCPLHPNRCRWPSIDPCRTFLCKRTYSDFGWYFHEEVSSWQNIGNWSQLCGFRVCWVSSGFGIWYHCYGQIGLVEVGNILRFYLLKRGFD